jgi:hypothetical protein
MKRVRTVSKKSVCVPFMPMIMSKARTSLASLALAVAGSVLACHSRDDHAPPASTAKGVQLWPGISEETTPSSLAEAWTGPWLNGMFSFQDGKRLDRTVRTVSSCADLAGVAESDVRLALGWEHYTFREKSVRCRVIGRLRTAHAASVSYSRDLVFSDDPGSVLPAVVAPGAASGVQDGRSWRAADPALTFSRDGARGGYHELIAHDSEYRGRLTWVAAGDLDGDGAEDVVMLSNFARIQGNPDPSFNVVRAFALTRRHPGSPVTIVERFE